MDEVRDYEAANDVACIILAGGEGTRLRPLTLFRCKPAMIFGGKYRLVDIPISNSIDAHIDNIFILAQYLGHELEKHLIRTYSHKTYPNSHIKVLSPDSPGIHNSFNGTADAVRKTLDYVLSTRAKYFLILSGDQLYSMDLDKLINFAKKKKADLTIASLPLRKKDATRMGLLKINKQSLVTDFKEKPKDPHTLKQFVIPPELLEKCNIDHLKTPRYLASMGIYVFEREALISILNEKGDDFGKDIIPSQIKNGKTYAYIYDGYWEDIGTVASYFQANLALTTTQKHLNISDELHPILSTPQNLPSPIIKDTILKNALISQGSVIEAKKISHSLIGMRSFIKKGTIIEDSIIMGSLDLDKSTEFPLTIGKNCRIKKAIIDENAHIGDNVHLINAKHKKNFDGNGIFIRDGIIIVTKGTVIPNGFVL